MALHWVVALRRCSQPSCSLTRRMALSFSFLDNVWIFILALFLSSWEHHSQPLDLDGSVSGVPNITPASSRNRYRSACSSAHHWYSGKERCYPEAVVQDRPSVHGVNSADHWNLSILVRCDWLQRSHPSLDLVDSALGPHTGTLAMTVQSQEMCM